ncbi:exodeoxyribonuclease VII small subunit [bacterium]|nr:exodeoxyribonuclease VII small subunit [bacterium]
MASDNILDKMTFEDAMRELEKLVDSLDKGDVSLDEAIAAYDRGSQLKDHCQKKLNEAKMKVETIQASDPANSIPDKLTPFNSD